VNIVIQVNNSFGGGSQIACELRHTLRLESAISAGWESPD
jgi:hypothetical protein